MPRGRKPPPLPAGEAGLPAARHGGRQGRHGAPGVAGPVVRIDTSKLQIGDLLVFTRLSTLSSADEAASAAALAEAIPMLDRLVVGGISHRPLSELSAVMQAVGAEIAKLGNQKN
jgi:hypothetical protein